MKVSDICDINKSYVNFTKDQLVDYLDTGNLTEGVIDSLAKVRYGDAPSRAQRAVEKDTILYSTVRPNLKHYGIVAEYNPNMVVSTGFTTIDVKENKKEEIDAHFLYYLMAQQWVTKHLHTIAQSSVSSYPSISPSDIGNLEFEFPLIATQRRIASVLSNIDKKIALNRQINANLEALAKQLYDYWFVQFDFPDANGNPYKSSGGKMVYNEKLKRHIPDGWKDGRLADIANITMGQSPDGRSYNEEGKGIIFYQGSTDFGERFPDVRQYTTEPSRYAKKGDILMSVRAPVGALNIANNDCCIGRGLAAINSKLGSMTHLYYVMLSFKEMFDRMSDVGTTFGSITKDELYGLPVVKPDGDIIKKYEEKCKPIFEQQMILGAEITSLTKQRDELLPLLMNGQATIE